MPEPAIEVVLFDLGGVLFDFGGVEPMKSLSGSNTTTRSGGVGWAAAGFRIQRGGCSAEQFAEGVVADWALPITADAFLRSFRSWLGGPLAGADVLVGEVRNKVKVGCLSNTERAHWTDHEHRWELVSTFDFRFLSFQMGYVKPDREIFDRTAQLLDRPRIASSCSSTTTHAINVEGTQPRDFTLCGPSEWMTHVDASWRRVFFLRDSRQRSSSACALRSAAQEGVRGTCERGLTMATRQQSTSRRLPDKVAIATITMAFGNDPVPRWALQDANEYLTYWPRLVKAFAGATLRRAPLTRSTTVVAWRCGSRQGDAPDEETMGGRSRPRPSRPTIKKRSSVSWARWASSTRPSRTGTCRSSAST